MRILHVGWGYTPLRYGGVIVYVEDLQRALVARGHELHYFCSGRGDLALVPRVHSWRREGVHLHELRNPPVCVSPLLGTHYPELDIDHAGVRRLFRRLLEKVRPDVVHIHEFYGLPARIVEDVKAAGIRLVITLEDLHCLCPTLLLFRADTGMNCRDYREGQACVACCRNAPRDIFRRRLKSAAWHAAAPVRDRTPRLYRGVRVAGHAALQAWDRLRHTNGNGNGAMRDFDKLERGFRFRRAEFVRLLGYADVLHTLSSALSRIHREYGVAGDKLVRIGTTVEAIGRIRPSTRQPGRPLVFGFRGLFNKGKGGDVLLESFRELPPGQAVLHIHGFLDPALETAVRKAEARGQVRYFGRYGRENLQAILDATDVGVVPSVWQEGYPLVGLEFLAARIPVIATRAGGIPDFVLDGHNGVLVPPGDSNALRVAVERFIADPGLVTRLRAQIGPVKTMDEHVREIEALYQ